MKRYLSIKQLIEVLPYSERQLKRLIDEGTIPYTQLKPGGKIMIPEDKLTELLESDDI